MPDEPEDSEISNLVMPRDPSLPATQLLEVPAERPAERPLTAVRKPGDEEEEGEPAADDFADTTLPVSDDANTLDQPMPSDAFELSPEVLPTDWDDDVETVVEDPKKKKG